MLKVKVITTKGTEKGELSLPKEYGEKYSLSLLDQAVRVYEDNSHPGLAKTKTRAEVNKTKKKLYKQKGTGGARHGSKRAPIFVGGGIAHGRSGVKRILELPTKMKKVATIGAISQKLNEKKISLVEGLSKVVKTSEAGKALESIKKALDLKGKVLVVLSKENIKALRFYKNIKDVKVLGFNSLNAFNVKQANYLLIEDSVFGTKESKKESRVDRTEKETKAVNKEKKVTKKIVKKENK